MSSNARVTIIPASELDAATRTHMIALVNDAFLKHDWLFPGIERTDEVSFAEENAGADVILIHDPTAGTFANLPVAVGVLRPDEHDPAALYVSMVCVPRALHGRGYGTTIMETVEAEARRRGFARVTLTTIPEIGNATYYERKGYAIISREPRATGTWGSNAPYAIVRMAKDL